MLLKQFRSETSQLIVVATGNEWADADDETGYEEI